jgi:hypothetical protein
MKLVILASGNHHHGCSLTSLAPVACATVPPGGGSGTPDNEVYLSLRNCSSRSAMTRWGRHQREFSTCRTLPYRTARQINHIRVVAHEPTSRSGSLALPSE